MVPGSQRRTGLQLMQFNIPTSPKTENKNMTTRHLEKTIGRAPLRLAFLVVPLVFAGFALLPATLFQGVRGQEVAPADRRPALRRLFRIPAAKTRPPVMRRSVLTAPVAMIQPLGFKRSLTTTATTIRPRDSTPL